MSNPPAIPFVIPFAPVAFHVVVNGNGVQPDGSNVPVPDTTSPLIFTGVSNPSGYAVAVDPADNRRVIVTPGLLTPSPSGTTPMPWSFRISVAGRLGTVTVSGSTAFPLDVSSVTWDGVAPAPA